MCNGGASLWRSSQQPNKQNSHTCTDHAPHQDHTYWPRWAGRSRPQHWPYGYKRTIADGAYRRPQTRPGDLPPQNEPLHHAGESRGYDGVYEITRRPARQTEHALASYQQA